MAETDEGEDRADLDRMIAHVAAQAFWRPLQVAAWITSRNMEIVAIIETAVAPNPNYSPAIVQAGAYFELLELVDGPEGESVAVVGHLIVESAGSGKIGATALEPGGAIRRPLATYDWAAVRLNLADFLEAITPEPERFSNADRHWTALRFGREQVVSVWPPESREKITTPATPQGRMTKREGDKLAAALKAQGVRKTAAVSALRAGHGNTVKWWRERYGYANMGRPRLIPLTSD